MSEIVEHFERKARFKDESEAEVIREKLEQFVTSILAQVEKRDKRFKSTLVHSGSVYEGVKVRQPDEFDFMIRIDSLTDKPSFHPCDKGEGYTKLVLDEQGWEEFKDVEGFFNPNLLSRYFKKLVNASLNDVELPTGLAIQRVNRRLFDETWWPVFSELLGNSGGQENPSGVMYSETHGPATTLYINWQGGNSYRNLIISVDLTLTLDYRLSKLPVQLAEFPQEVDAILQNCGFHVVPAGIDSWRISFSMAEKEILVSSPEGFSACYRALKVLRDDISQRLGWDPSLVPSYMFKTVLLSQLIITDRHLWEKNYWSQRIIQVLELILQGVMREEILSFFIPKHNLLTVSDHENKLRLYVVEDMLSQINGLEFLYTPEEARERKQQIRVLEMIDLLDYIISGLLAGKNPTAIWNKMFVNIGNVVNSRKTGWFWNEVTDLNTTELSENAYRKLVQIWRWMEVAFKQLLTTLKGELNLLAHKFYLRTCEKKKKFELEHRPGLFKHNEQQISPRQVAFEWLEDMVDCYIKENNPTLPNLHKAVCREFSAPGLFHGIADVTVREGSSKGLALLKQRLEQYLLMVPDNFIITAVVDYVSQIIFHAKEVLKRKLDYITIPELDLD
ncbi:hypothetical protein ACROYT_G031349 [Oculina patagonica]